MTGQPDDPMADADDHPITWERAVEWWVHSPLLRARTLPQPGWEESIYVFYPGVEKSSRTDHAAVQVFYGYSPYTVDRHSYWVFLDNGGFQVEARYFAPGSELPYQNPAWTDRVVTVRSRPASLKEMRKPRDGNNYRMIRWFDRLSDGGSLMWKIGNHPELYTVEQTIEFADLLEEVR